LGFGSKVLLIGHDDLPPIGDWEAVYHQKKTLSGTGGKRNFSPERLFPEFRIGILFNRLGVYEPGCFIKNRLKFGVGFPGKHPERSPVDTLRIFLERIDNYTRRTTDKSGI
jgi:hypothetical protein